MQRASGRVQAPFHRMAAELGGHLWASSGPTLHSEQGHAQWAAKDCVQWGFEYLQGWSLHDLSGYPVPMFDHPSRKMFFLMFKWNFLCFSSCPAPLAFHWTTLRRVWLCLLYAVPIMYLHTLIRCPFSTPHRLSSLSLSSYGRSSKPLIHGSSLDSLQYSHVFLLNGKPKLNILLQLCLTSTNRRITSLTLSLRQPRRLLASLLAHSHLELSAPFLQVSAPQTPAQIAEHQPCTVLYQLQALSLRSVSSDNTLRTQGVC